MQRYRYFPAHPPVPPYYYPPRQYLPIDPKMFMNSAKKMVPILKDAQGLMSQISGSNTFAKKLMDAAQHSKTNEVKKLIAQAGIQSKSDIRYNPSGLIFTLSDKNDPTDCCQVEVRIRWM